jgi:26S proteasome regulatory subunit N2
LKKVTTEKAPVAGNSMTGGAATGRSLQDRRDHFAQLQEAGQENARSMYNSQMQDAIARHRAGSQLSTPNAGRNEPGTGSGAAAAAGVLTAIDEDQEGDEEAPVPDGFDYHTDAEEDE